MGLRYETVESFKFTNEVTNESARLRKCSLRFSRDREVRQHIPYTILGVKYLSQRSTSHKDN